MSSLKLEVSNEPEKKDLLDEEEEPIENNEDIEINYEYELQKCFPNLKECPGFYTTWRDDLHPTYNEKEEYKKYNYLELIGFYSGFSITFFVFLIFLYLANAIAFFVVYFILVGLQFLHPEIKRLLKARKHNKKDFEEFQNKINFMTKRNLSYKKRFNKENSFKFIVKNYIDISGELEMTKPQKELILIKKNKI